MKIGTIGTGNIGEALARKLSPQDTTCVSQIRVVKVYARLPARSEQNQGMYTEPSRVPTSSSWPFRYLQCESCPSTCSQEFPSRHPSSIRATTIRDCGTRAFLKSTTG
jgi:hypothetical protein